MHERALQALSSLPRHMLIAELVFGVVPDPLKKYYAGCGNNDGNAWMPDPLHFNYLRRRACGDLTQQLDLASCAAKAGVPGVEGLFSGYAALLLRELLDLTCAFDPKLQLRMRAFREPFPVSVEATATRERAAV